MSRNINFIIPAAGLGSRFKNNGFDVPKPLIPIAGIPMILWVIGNIPFRPGDTLTIITRGNIEIMKLWDDLAIRKPEWIKECQILELTEGPAITVSHGLQSLDLNLPLVVLNSDQFVDFDLTEYLNKLRNSDFELGSILTMYATEEKWSYVGRDDNGQINRIVEKEVISDEATVGVYGWSKGFLFKKSLDWLQKIDLRVNGEFYVAPSYNYLIANKIPIETYNLGKFPRRVYGLGTVPDYNEFLENKKLLNFREKIYRNLLEMNKK